MRSGGPIPGAPAAVLSRTVIADAAHRDFSDGPLFEPSLLPFPRTIDRVNAQIRGAIREFFQQTLIAR